MVVWTNRAVFQAPRNGTNSHTINPASTTDLVSGAAFTPTAGRRLVVVVEGAVTSTTPSGWTLPSGGSAISESGLYVWYRTAAGGDTFATTHNGSNYPVIFAVYEFPAGSTFVKSVSGTGVSNTGANPNLTGLSGTNLIVGAKATVMTSGWTYGGAVWSSGYTEDYDGSVPFSSTDGYWLTVAAQEGVTASSAQPTATISGTAFTAEALTFALNVPAGGVTMSAGGTLSLTGSSSFVERGTRTASGALVINGSVVVSAREILSASGSLSLAGVAALSTPAPVVTATGGMSLSGNVVALTRFTAVAQGSLTLNGSATLTAQNGVSVAGTLALNGSTTLSPVIDAASGLTLTGAAQLVARRYMSATGALVLDGGSQVSVIESVIATGSLYLSGTALLWSGDIPPVPERRTLRVIGGRNLNAVRERTLRSTAHRTLRESK